MNSGVVTIRGDRSVAVRAGADPADTGRADTGRAGDGEVEVLPRSDAGARPARVVFDPAPGPPTEGALVPRRRQRPGVDRAGRTPANGRSATPVTGTVGVTFTAPTTTDAPPALPTRPGDLLAPGPGPAPHAPACVVIGPPPVLPGGTPTSRSTGELIPRSTGELTPRPGGELIPRSTGGLSPRSVGGLTPRPGGGLALRPAGGVAPRSSGGFLSSRSVSAGGSLLGWLFELARAGRTRARGLTAQDQRILACLGVALVVALGGQVGPVDVAAPAPAGAPAALAADADVAPAAQVLALAGTQVGTVEARDGSTPYHRDYGLAPNQPWCAIFIWDLFQDTGSAASIHPKTAFTPTLAGWFRERGQWSATPAVGALVFYDWPGDRLDRIQHVGIVESFTATTITTIEGNTSNSTFGSQDDGDGVWRRTRPRDDSVVGYGLPIYGVAA